MGYKLLFCDLDGTLLDEHYRLSPENAAALAEISARGIQLIPTTGRCVREIPEALKTSPYIREIASSNGSRIIDSKSGEVVHLHSIEREAADFLETLRLEYGVMECFHYGGNVHASSEEMARHNELGMDDYYYGAIAPAAVMHEDFAAFRRSLPSIDMCAWFFKTPDAMQACRARLSTDERFSLTTSSDCVLEIIARGVSKGAALRLLAERLGVPLEETIAAGDSGNDIAMLEAAGLGLATANAAEYTKCAAARVICDHREHILPYILKHIL